MVERSPYETVAGCLFGCAVGDALGAPVEMLSLAQIRAQFGSDGIRTFAPAYGRTGAITDDTQMTLFTAEGLLRAHNRLRRHGRCHAQVEVHKAYLRWLHTQGCRSAHPLFPKVLNGWLIGVQELHASRAPGATCLSALQNGRMGTIEHPLNNSKGCGGLMRIAPVGFVHAENHFRLGCEIAALTHGHPSGYLAAGFLAQLIHELVDGVELRAAIERTMETLVRWNGHEECRAAVEKALRLADGARKTPAEVALLGEGWVAEEALAIALFCALVADDFAEGVLLAVNHDGDSDSTGAITGSILGTMLGVSAIPRQWREQVELREVIEQIARDMTRHFFDPSFAGDADDRARYPDG